MVQTSEGTFTVDGQELYTKTWLPDGPPVAKLIAIHGFSDHINLYYDLFPTLASRGIAVYGFDQRGWGRSVKKPSDKGRTGPTSTVIADIAAFIKPHVGQGDGIPVFVFGHSMGGNQVATLMAAPVGSELDTTIVKNVRGWLLSAPFFAFPPSEAPTTFKIVAGRLAGRLLPHFQLKHELPRSYLSRDPEVIAQLEKDTLCHDTGTLEGLAGLLDRVNDITQGRVKPSASVQSVWLGHGDADPCTDYNASKRWFETSAAAVPDKTFRTYDKWLHKLHAEPKEDRELYYRECGDWILARVGNKDAAPNTIDAPIATGAAETAPVSSNKAAAPEAAPAAAAAAEESAAEAKL